MKIKRLILASLILAGAVAAADRSMWLLTMTNIPGVPETSTPVTQYGVQVFLGSDDPLTVGWDVSLEVQLGDGSVVTFSGYQIRNRDAAPDAVFSDIWVAWIGPDVDFKVLKLTVTGRAGGWAVAVPPQV